VPYWVYAEQDVLATEQRRIFEGPVWNYLCLEVDLPNVGDYRTTFIGSMPVVVVRADDGELCGFENRCAHRGALICLEDGGTAKDFQCVYHSWRYDLRGNLCSVAFRHGVNGKGGMSSDFDMAQHGPRKLRITTCCGLVFGTLSDDTPDFENWIGGEIAGRIRRVLGNKKIEIIGRFTQALPNNWKLYFENVRDTYHASLLHTFFTTFRISRLTSEGGVHIGEDGGNHATYARNKTDHAGADQLYAGIPSQRGNFRLADPAMLEFKDEFGDGITTQILAVFPNFVLQQIHNSLALRLVVPKGPDKTELLWTYIGFEEDDAEMTSLRLAQANLVGPAGYVSMEDGAVGNFIQRAIHGSEEDCSVLEMGGFDHVSANTRTSEASVRGFWNAYRQMMGL
jgi:anthranilate 1,2-dioxygenase large subunit/terephthalate 1,2-dioxygenase oxygenase component alpha subunit